MERSPTRMKSTTAISAAAPGRSAASGPKHATGAHPVDQQHVADPESRISGV